MKKVKIKTLSLNKETISKLNEEHMNAIKGGDTVVTNTGSCVNCGGSYIAACKTKICSGVCGPGVF
jgi:natural product precursor